MSIFFDFSEVYKNEFNRRNSGASFYKYLDENNLELDTFVKELFIKENTFYIACSSMERRLLKDINFSYYKNFFIRAKNNNYTLRGDFIISDKETYFKVNDIYIDTSKSIKKYEKEFSFNVSLKNDYKRANSEEKLVKEIINETINIFDYHYLEFVKNYDNYLEFEKKHFSKKLGFYKTNSFEVIELKEIKRNLNSLNKYESDLYFDDGNNYIYLNNDVSVSEEFNRVIVIEFNLTISKSKYSDLQFFASQEIELANEKEALENDKLKCSDNELEFNFKTQKLGELFKNVEIIEERENEYVCVFSKFYNEEDKEITYSAYRVKDYLINKCGDNPLLVNILSGDIALYKRGKQALKDLREGNVKNPGIASYLFNISDFENSEDILKREDIKWSNNNLDKYQKEAVYKAINSNSIFLLQGPPGTGKTQTITEMVYQFNKMGKKVLLSSQTHVAIDNVIERLPNELDILPIRLVNSERKLKASKSYLPDRIMDNFYDKVINKYSNKELNFNLYSEEMESSLKEYRTIENLVNKLGNDRKLYQNIIKNINKLNSHISKIDNEISVLVSESDKDDRLSLLKEERRKLSISLNNLIKEKNSYYKKDYLLIDEYFDKYFNKFINLNKRPLSDEECLKEIKEYIDKKQKEFNEDKDKYNEYKDLYKNVSNYLLSNEEELLINDKEKYTRMLLNNNANVYCLTCNANSKYLEEKNEYLKSLGLGNIELRNIDFDVVIIDEVSKASGIELLIPILYGKSIILVGDHRQLPPLFKYKENMFREDEITKETLDKYKELIEASMFKDLFKKARKNKYMLINQYRSHEQIMNIVNIFYDDKLRLGNDLEQNEAKRHYLNTTSNGYNLFSEDLHTYWFNSHYDINHNVSYEKKKVRGSSVSTSFYNEEEIYLTKEILKHLDKEYEKLINDKVIREPLSVGVISLYGDQVSELKKEVNKMKFRGINFNKNKVSTVDEFQGKEEDIIIVNFVRNNPSYEAGEFARKFERINVALSRARKMLIIVGSKEFFTKLRVRMENLDDSSLVKDRKIYAEIYDRVTGKIDAPNNYFMEVSE